MMQRKLFNSPLLALLFVISPSVSLVCAQAVSSAGSSVTVTIPPSVSQNGFTGSVPTTGLSPTPLSISFLDAIDRGLKQNLGLLLSDDNTVAARGAKWKELSNLLPNVVAKGHEDVQQTSLTALGIRLPGLPRVIGPFNYFDARASLTQSVFNWNYIQKERAAAQSQKAAEYSYKDARELVVLVTGNAYLQAIAGAARIETTEAQVKTSQTLFSRASDQQKAGVIPAVDALRAQVELQNRQQQLIVARNNLAKSTLSVARVIGLPPGQQFVLTEKAPYETFTPQPVEIYLQRAYAGRADYKSALAQVESAELSRKAASAGHYPSLDMNANFGDIGTNPSQSNGTWQVIGGINIPVFAGNRVHADVLEAEAQLRQARSKLGDLRGQIDYEVRTAVLDLNAAAEQVEVARSSVDLAEQTLTQSQDRFTAGVVDSLEVVQAQEAVANAHENYIQSLYAHNLAKVELAYVIGDAERGVREYLKGNH